MGFSSTSCSLLPSFRREPFTPITDADIRSPRFFGASAAKFCLLLERDRAPRTALPEAVTAVMELDLDRDMSRTFLMRRTYAGGK